FALCQRRAVAAPLAGGTARTVTRAERVSRRSTAWRSTADAGSRERSCESVGVCNDRSGAGRNDALRPSSARSVAPKLSTDATKRGGTRADQVTLGGRHVGTDVFVV